PTRQHIAYLGGILQDDVKHVERRAAFWAKATAKLDALSKRVSPEERRKLEAALEVRIPKPSSEEIRSYHRAQQRRQDCLPARCRCGTSTDKNTHREKPGRGSAATGPTPAISGRERAEKEPAPPLHDNPKARRRGGRHTRGAAACCDARFRPDL